MTTATVVAPITSEKVVNAAIVRWLTHCSVVIADLVAFSLAGALAVMVRYVFHGQFSPAGYIAFAPSILIFFAVFTLAGLYPGVAISPIEEFRRILRSSSVVFLLIIGATFFLREAFLSSRGIFVLAWMFTIVLVPASRRCVRGWCSRKPWWGIPTVILGEQAAGYMMLNMLEGHPRIGLRPVALLVDNSLEEESDVSTSSHAFCGDLSHAATFARHHRHSYAIIAMPRTGCERVKAVLNEHAERYRRVLIIPDLFGMTSLEVSAKDICGILALEVNQRLTQAYPQLIKRSFDLLIAAVAAVLLAPLFIILYLAVKLTSTGPAFYGHRRIGREGKEFRVWKFRSMVTDGDAVLKRHLEVDDQLRQEWERDHKLRRDPRITAVGQILRKTSLDELPQLWNVLCGQMSLVGPRPIVHSEVEKYGLTFRQYRRVTPGITGLWQISGRNNTTYELRTQIDDYYIRNWSVSLDIYILFRTLKTVLLTEGAY